MPRNRNKGFTLLELMIVILVVAILSAILTINFIRYRAIAQRTSCAQNLKDISTKLEMYANDNTYRYPTNLAQLAQGYIVAIPTCPSGGSVTYIAGYTSASNPDNYTVRCSGSNHLAADAPPDYPVLTLSGGLVEK